MDAHELLVQDGDAEEEEEEGGDRVDADGVSWHVDHEKLTRAQRNKRERAKARERAEREAKQARVRERQLGRVGTLVSELTKEEKQLQEKQQAEAAWEAARPKKLGGKRYAPKRPDVLLTDEQPSALRQLATEGSLLVDRFDSWQARNIIEVRAKRERKDKFGTKGQKGPRRRLVREDPKARRFKSPHYRGPLPAWM